jgi:hypothetical protein
MTRRTAAIMLVLVLTMGLAASPDAMVSLFDARQHEHKSQTEFARSAMTPTERVEGPHACVEGLAFELFACDGVDLLSFVPTSEFAGDTTLTEANPLSNPEGSDIWGWTDPVDGREYVIMGKTNGVAFLDITDPTSPVHVASLENTSFVQLIWFDIKTYRNHAFIVSESAGHGMLVVDLTRLRDLPRDGEPALLAADATYPFIGSAHNIAINTDTGFAYLVGNNAGLVVQDQCRSGLHMVDIRTPLRPTFAGCYGLDGGPGTLGRLLGVPSPNIGEARATGAYIHDSQCVLYDGPDTRFDGREICINSAEDRVTIVDVTDKLLPELIASVTYPDATYTHQAWLTEDHRYLLVNDELDETNNRNVDQTRTIIFDLALLDEPGEAMVHTHDYVSIDHNLYTHGGVAYQSHYTAGLRINDLARVGEGVLDEIAFFDVHPDSEDPDDPTFERAVFAGTWSNYPYFESGVIAVSGYDGLWLVQVQDDVLPSS